MLIADGSLKPKIILKVFNCLCHRRANHEEIKKIWPTFPGCNILIVTAETFEEKPNIKAICLWALTVVGESQYFV